MINLGKPILLVLSESEDDNHVEQVYRDGLFMSFLLVLEDFQSLIGYLSGSNKLWLFLSSKNDLHNKQLENIQNVSESFIHSRFF